jgi:hypothetical protein
VGVAGSAEQASTIDDVPFRRHPVADADIRHELPDLGDVTRELVADRDRWLHAALCPIVPFIDVDVGSADPCPAHPDEHLVIPDRRLRNVLQREPRTRAFFHQRFHVGSTPVTCVCLPAPVARARKVAERRRKVE